MGKHGHENGRACKSRKLKSEKSTMVKLQSKKVKPWSTEGKPELLISSFEHICLCLAKTIYNSIRRIHYHRIRRIQPSIQYSVLIQLINMVYPLPLDTTYRSSGTESKSESSTNELFTPYKEPERELHSSKRHIKTLSLDELRSPDFNLLFDQEYSEEEEAETMAETMEQYMSKTRADYGSGVVRPKIEDKD
ncbi:hypothetical protein Tco_0606185 [Tanacetum coccineum]